MSDATVDNVLHVVTSCFDKLAREDLNNIIENFFKADELLASKLLLVSECEKIGVKEAISEFKKKRLNTKSENDIKQKLSKDILDIWSVVDIQKGGQFSTSFIPTNLPSASASTPLSTASSAPTASFSENNVDVKELVALISSLKDDFEKQKESIRWLTNITKHIYRRIDTIPG